MRYQAGKDRAATGTLAPLFQTTVFDVLDEDHRICGMCKLINLRYTLFLS
jgi:hypothetical protein